MTRTLRPARRLAAATTVAALALTLAACGGDDDDDTVANPPAATGAPSTDAPTTDAPSTDAPATDAPAVEDEEHGFAGGHGRCGNVAAKIDPWGAAGRSSTRPPSARISRATM